MKRKIRNMNLVDFFHRNTSINKFNQEKLFYNIGKLYSTEKFLSESTVKPNEFSSNPNNIKLKNKSVVLAQIGSVSYFSFSLLIMDYTKVAFVFLSEI